MYFLSGGCLAPVLSPESEGTNVRSPKFYNDLDIDGRIPGAAAGLRRPCEAGVGSQEMLLLSPCRRPTLPAGK